MNNSYFTPLPGRLVETNGTEMFVTEAGRGPAVLLIHGLGWSHALWHRVIAKLSGSYRVIAADTRGHASSAKPAGPYTMEQLTDDWAGILEACKVDRLAIVGVSQGGMIAMTLASREPDRVAALGLLGTASHFPEAAWARMQERGNVLREMGPRAAAEHTSRSVFSAKFALQHPAFLADFVENRLSASAPALGAATASLQGFDIRDRVSKVRCPVLIMHGTADGVIAHDSTAETSSVLPQAQTVLVEDAGHILPVESANLVETHLSRFLHANHCKPIGTAEAL